MKKLYDEHLECLIKPPTIEIFNELMDMEIWDEMGVSPCVKDG